MGIVLSRHPQFYPCILCMHVAQASRFSPTANFSMHQLALCKYVNVLPCLMYIFTQAVIVTV